jgi:hypothetical protein
MVKTCKNCFHCKLSLAKPSGRGKDQLDYPLIDNLNVRAVYCEKGKWGDLTYTSKSAFDASSTGQKFARDCIFYDYQDEFEV